MKKVEENFFYLFYFWLEPKVTKAQGFEKILTKGRSLR